jgi:plastocyanin
MKKLFLLPLAMLAALLVATAAGASTQTVQITKNGFTPSDVTIAVGDTVTWHNADTADHQVVADDGSFASPVLHTDQSYSHTFTAAGKVKYHDAFAKSHTGTVTVNGPPLAVTLNAVSQTVVYGSGTTLSGKVSGLVMLSGEPVALTAQPYGKGAQSLESTSTASDGSYSFAVSPTIQTTYQSHWRAADSSPVTVNVAPRVGFGLNGRIYTAKVTSDLSYSGHYVWLQRHTSLFGWTNIKRVYLGSTSRATFMVRLPHGRTMLRLVLPAGQAGAGYVAGLSRTLVVTH